jgi:hypothetical protein
MFIIIFYEDMEKQQSAMDAGQKYNQTLSRLVPTRTKVQYGTNQPP